MIILLRSIVDNDMGSFAFLISESSPRIKRVMSGGDGEMHGLVSTGTARFAAPSQTDVHRLPPGQCTQQQPLALRLVF